MSFQEYEDLISELEGQNEDLRYRLSFSVTEQDNLSSGLRDLISENEQLVHTVMNLEQALKAERENAISREHSLRRVLKEKNIIIEELETSPVGGSRMSLNSSNSELDEEGEGLKKKLHAAEQDIQARDMLIEELEMTIEDLHKQYHNNRVDSDITLYEMTENMKLLEEKLAEAEILLNDESIKYSDLLDKHHSFEELYEGLFEKFNHQLSLTEQLSDKLTATEFDLFATAERLDDIDQKKANHSSINVGTCTDGVSVDIEKLKLTGELDRLTEKYESSVYRVSELSVNNSTLETRLIDVETELDNYHQLLSRSSPKLVGQKKDSSSSSLNYLLSKKEETIHNLTIKLEEFQSEKLKRENELLEKLNDLTTNKHQLCERLESYEDEIFELSEQIAIIETEKEETCGRKAKLKAISRRLSTLNLLSVRDTPLLSPVDKGKCSEVKSRHGSVSSSDVDGNDVLRVSTQDLANARDRAAELERYLEQSNTDLDSAKLKISEIEKKVSDLESEQQDNLEKLDDRKSEIDSLKREISRYKTIEDQHERMKAEQAKQVESASRNTEIAALNATILNKNSEIETLKARVDDYEASSEVSKKCLKTLQATVTELEATVTELEANVADLEAKIEQGAEKEKESELTFQANVADLEANIADLEAKLEKGTEKEKESELIFQVNIKTLEGEVEEGKIENELLFSSFKKELNMEVQKMSETYSLSLDEKMAELNSLRAELDRQSPEIDQLRQNLITKENDLDTISVKLSTTELELQKSKERQDEGEAMLVKLQLRIDDLVIRADENATSQARSWEEKTNLELLYLQNDIKSHLTNIEELKESLSKKSFEHEQATGQVVKQAEELLKLRVDITTHLALIDETKQQVKDATEQLTEKDGEILSNKNEKNDLLVVLEKMQRELETQLAKIETLTKEVERVTTDRDEALKKLAELKQKLSQNMDYIRLKNSEKESVDEMQNLLAMDKDTGRNIGHSLYEMGEMTTYTMVEKQTRELRRLTDELQASTIAVVELKEKCDGIAKERDEFDNKAEEAELKGDKEISELKSQLNKMTNESEEIESNKRNTKELISKLEQQVACLKSEKDKAVCEIHSAEWQKQMAMVGGVAGAGVASAVAYLTALYSC